MKKLSLAVTLCGIMGFASQSACAQDTPLPPPDARGTVEKQPSEPQALAKGQGDDNPELSYPLVEASYVGGTIPGMPLESNFTLWQWLEARQRQLRVKGKLAIGPQNLLFVFKSTKGNEHTGSNYEVSPCYPPGPKLSVGASAACEGLVKNSTESDKDVRVIQIPFRKINVLSRAKYAVSDLNSVSLTYASAAGGLLTALYSSIGKTQAKARAVGIAAGGLAVYYYLAIARPRLSDNYIAVFIVRESGQEKPDKDELFARGDLVMFRVPNYHDYYNISMILSAETGLTFVSETAEKSGK